jgi:hypothetical protein
MPDGLAKRRRRLTLRRLLTLSALAIGVGALLRARPPTVTALGKPTAPPGTQAVLSGYETTDIDVRGTACILGAIAATTMLVVGIVFTMVWRFDVARHAAWSHLAPQQTARLVPPAPHLQLHPFSDLARVRAREELLLHSYGWISANHQIARIPIDRAMALTVGKSLDAPP